MSDVVSVIVFSVASFVFLFIISKIMGKKQIAQLEFIDYVIGISLGSIAANMATDTENPFYHYLIGMTIFLLLDLLISFISRKSAFLKKLFKGKPLILIEDGKINYDNLKKSKIDVNDLSGMARDKNIFSLDEIAFAIYETNGHLSILPKAANKPLECKDLDIVPERPELERFLVVDGKLSKDNLEYFGMTEEWVLKGLHVQNKKDLENILIATYDEKEQNFVVHYKYDFMSTEE